MLKTYDRPKLNDNNCADSLQTWKNNKTYKLQCKLQTINWFVVKQ